MATQPQATGALLAGGAGRRMGRDKRLVEIDGEPMIRRSARALAAGTDELLIVVAQDRPIAPGLVVDLGARMVEDRLADGGPLAGLEAALAAARHDLVVVAAADMPWLAVAVVRHLVARLAGATPAIDVVAVATDRGPEPLLACYRRQLLPTVTRLLDTGERRMTALLEATAVEAIPPAEWRRLDPSGRSATNVNRPADLLATQGRAS
jgi:molybdopterin-guanine dinucleotide biosynthesis protein A